MGQGQGRTNVTKHPHVGGLPSTERQSLLFTHWSWRRAFGVWLTDHMVDECDVSQT